MKTLSVRERVLKTAKDSAETPIRPKAHFKKLIYISANGEVLYRLGIGLKDLTLFRKDHRCMVCNDGHVI